MDNNSYSPHGTACPEENSKQSGSGRNTISVHWTQSFVRYLAVCQNDSLVRKPFKEHIRWNKPTSSANILLQSSREREESVFSRFNIIWSWYWWSRSRYTARQSMIIPSDLYAWWRTSADSWERRWWETRINMQCANDRERYFTAIVPNKFTWARSLSINSSMWSVRIIVDPAGIK